ncbi:MAG: alpha-galactosidase [Pseudomonadota bacterium]
MKANNEALVLQCWRLDSKIQTLVFASWHRQLPEIIYLGAPLSSSENLTRLAESQVRPVSRGTLDQINPLSICPEAGRGYLGEPGLVLRNATGGVVLTQFELEELVEEGAHITFRAVDPAHEGLAYSAQFDGSCASGVVRASASIEGLSKTGLVCDWLSAPVLPLPDNTSEIIDFAGRWTREFGENRTSIARGSYHRENRRGRTGHDHFPAFMTACGPASHAKGEMFGVHLGWSGNHSMRVDVLADGRRAALSGRLDPQRGDVASTPEIHFAWSDTGRNGLAIAFQDHVRASIVPSLVHKTPRRVHYNCWEAVYFDHQMEELKTLADRAAALGAERFVLDDGWFKRRNDDHTSLGDWHVDEDKYPDGLTPLIDHVLSTGMDFGLWVEPEMVNLESDLARAHPDWIIMPGDRVQVSGRNQHVLDLTNRDVISYLYERLSSVLSTHQISYLKWDMNRDHTLAVDNGGWPISDRQTLALYKLLARLRAEFPTVEIESCASGGARIDYGILKQTDRVWLSDSNDAHERFRMQASASTFLPPEVVGSHVGPRHCHTSGRHLSMQFRALVALGGHMGMEMDLRELTDDEQAELGHWIQFYKENRDWLHASNQVQLEAGPDRLAQLYISQDQGRFLLMCATMESPVYETTARLRLDRINADQEYQLKLLNADAADGSASVPFTSPLKDEDGLVLSGHALMQAGIVLPIGFPDSMWIVAGQKHE